VIARYLVAAFAFIAAATWVGISLTGGLKCLFVFVLALQAVRLYQRRRRPASRRERPSREQAALAEEKIISSPVPPRRDRSRSSGVYSGNRQADGWPMASEAAR
jgi:membrane protein implicated in regulation of membrane protease activity